jgi:predicted glutamine amidotransferase
MQIGRKIYYDKATGNVYVDTGERSGDVIETTTEQDFATYTSLQGIDLQTVGCVQLDYGQDSDKFGVYLYHIDPTTESIVWTTKHNGTLADAKTQKLAQLAQFRDDAIYSSFTSSALGTTKTYNYSQKAASDFRGRALMLSLNPSTATVMWATLEDGFIEHTREQFIQVCTDGDAHQTTLEMHYYQLEDQVNAIVVNDTTTEDQAIAQVDAITW